MNTITRFGDFNVDGHEDVIARESATGSLWLYQGAPGRQSAREDRHQWLERYARDHPGR